MAHAATAQESDEHREFYEYDEEFRNSISTVDKAGKRVWVYPKKPSGFWHRKRAIVSVVLLTLFFAGPFITIGGKPATPS